MAGKFIFWKEEFLIEGERGRLRPRRVGAAPTSQYRVRGQYDLGGGVGERLANALLAVCAKTSRGDAQIVLTTPQKLPVSPQGLHATEHDSTRPLISHARPESDER